MNVPLYLNINILTFRNQLQFVLPDSLTTWEIQGVGISNGGKQIEVIYLREKWFDLAKRRVFKITIFLVYPELKGAAY